MRARAKKQLKNKLPLALAIMLGLAVGGSTYAGQPVLASGITVSPAQLTIDVPKGSLTQESAVGVRNDTPQTVHLQARIAGISQTSDGALIPADAAEPAIKNAVRVDQQEFSIDPGQSVNVKLLYTDSKEVAPGGHYASLLIQQVATGTGQLTLSQAVSVRLFIVKNEGATRVVTLGDVSSDGNIVRLPRSVRASFGNQGNTALVPRASILVTDAFGRQVATSILNTESLGVLPGKEVRLLTQLRPTARAWLPGIYTMQITYRYDGTDEQKGAVTRFLYVPAYWLIIVPALVIGAYIIWRFSRFWWRANGTKAKKSLHTKVNKIIPGRNTGN